MRLLGVDPGLNGGLAVLDERGALVAVGRMPLMRCDLADGTKRSRVDAGMVATFAREHAVTQSIIEEVNAFGMGATSAFSFGRDCGAVYGVLAALNLSPVWVDPKKWKGFLGLLCPKKPGESKEEHKRLLKHLAIVRAQAMFPGAAKDMAHDGCAEASLIAAYALLSRRI